MARAAWREGRLAGLNPEVNEGLLVTRGRFAGDRLFEITGLRQLPILLGTERLAVLYCLHVHAKGHFRDVAGILSRVRMRVWIVRGRRAARAAASSCMRCRREGSRPQQQQMGLVASELGQLSSPFNACNVDLFGPPC